MTINGKHVERVVLYLITKEYKTYYGGNIKCFYIEGGVDHGRFWIIELEDGSYDRYNLEHVITIHVGLEDDNER